MKTIICVSALFICLSTSAFILGSDRLSVDFTNPPSAITNVTWSDPNRISTSESGFGWDGTEHEYRDYWIQSIPIAIGTSWRPARAVHVGIVVVPSGFSWGRFFVRYSPDKQHWSSWQALESLQGAVEIPQIASAEYDQLRSEYSKMDVPWRDDEEAAGKWILKRYPDFFEKHQPFIGYLQFRMEGSILGNVRIRKIAIECNWGVSGLHSLPKDPNADKQRNGHWRFEQPSPVEANR